MLTIAPPLAALNLIPRKARYELKVRPVEQALAVTIRGELGVTEVERLRSQLRVLALWGRRVTVFDLEGVTLISGRAMAALVEYRDAVQRHGGLALIADPQPEVRQALERAGVHHLLPLVPASVTE
ncbi:MAG: STAS domain-containing protein [Planctomycetia bacterium]|nr:STAS domain-containing protein [Planctomycetia bacterium]